MKMRDIQTMTNSCIKKRFLTYFILFCITACSSSDGTSPNPDPKPVPIATFIMDEITKEETDGNDEMLQTLRVMTSVFVDTKVGDTAEMRINAKKEIDVPESIIGAVKSVMGLTLKLIRSQQPDPYLQGIKMLSDQIRELSDLVQNNTEEIMQMLMDLELQIIKTDLNQQVTTIKTQYNRYDDAVACLSPDGTEPDQTLEECSDEAYKAADKIYWSDLADALYNIHDLITSSNAYRVVSQASFDAEASASIDIQSDARNAFVNLSSFYFYVSSAQLIGYQLLLEACNCLPKACSGTTPQDYAARIYEQTKYYWTEVERLNIFGFQGEYPSGGMRMDNDTTSKGWIDWVDRRIKNIGSQDYPKYAGNQFFLQADMLAAAVNGFLQLAVIRGAWDPDADTYRNLSSLTDQWNKMNENITNPPIAPSFTLAAISNETKDLDSGDFELNKQVHLNTTSPLALQPLLLWRYVKTDIACPEILEWYRQGVENQSPTLLSVSATKDYTAWGRGRKRNHFIL